MHLAFRSTHPNISLLIFDKGKTGGTPNAPARAFGIGAEVLQLGAVGMLEERLDVVAGQRKVVCGVGLEYPEFIAVEADEPSRVPNQRKPS